MPDDRVADRVSADMERIFRRQDLPPAMMASGRVEGGRSRDFVLHASPARRSLVRLMRALTIAIPLLTIAVAAFLFLRIGTDIRPAAAVAQDRPATPRISVVAAATPSVPVAYNAVAPAGGAAPDAVVPAVFRPMPAAPPVSTPVRRARAPSPVPAAASPPVAAERECVPGSDANMCIYREVRDADRRLVAAYRAAADAGVPRREMVAIRRVWTRALAVSLDDPDGTIRTYDDLARRLRDAARAMRVDGDRA